MVWWWYLVPWDWGPRNRDGGFGPWALVWDWLCGLAWWWCLVPWDWGPRNRDGGFGPWALAWSLGAAPLGTGERIGMGSHPNPVGTGERSRWRELHRLQLRHQTLSLAAHLLPACRQLPAALALLPACRPGLPILRVGLVVSLGSGALPTLCTTLGLEWSEVGTGYG